MHRLVFILIMQFFVHTYAQAQSFKVDDLLKLAYQPSKNIEGYLKKKGFVFSGNKDDSTETIACFREKNKSNKKPEGCQRSIEINIKDDLKHLTLYTSAVSEYLEGQQHLIKAGFFYDTSKNLNKQSVVLFQKANITVKASRHMEDSTILYRFDLQEKSIPPSIRYAEDLLRFDSHQFLVSYFGEQNVKKDMYYLSEKELKRSSVLFGGTQRQAVFVWNDEIYLSNLAYIMFSNRLPTEGGLKNDPLSGNNEWQLKNGIHPGMALKDLLKINEMDFDIYGNTSELSFLVKPNAFGKIDFKKTAIMLSCHQCYDNKIFNQKEVSALQVAKANLPMRVFDVVIYR